MIASLIQLRRSTDPPLTADERRRQDFKVLLTGMREGILNLQETLDYLCIVAEMAEIRR